MRLRLFAWVLLVGRAGLVECSKGPASSHTHGGPSKSGSSGKRSSSGDSESDSSSSATAATTTTTETTDASQAVLVTADCVQTTEQCDGPSYSGPSSCCSASDSCYGTTAQNSVCSPTCMEGWDCANFREQGVVAPPTPPYGYTATPSLAPTSSSPTFAPTLGPTLAPTQKPTVPPTHGPTFGPTLAPSAVPTVNPDVFNERRYNIYFLAGIGSVVLFGAVLTLHTRRRMQEKGIGKGFSDMEAGLKAPVAARACVCCSCVKPMSDGPKKGDGGADESTPLVSEEEPAVVPAEATPVADDTETAGSDTYGSASLPVATPEVHETEVHEYERVAFDPDKLPNSPEEIHSMIQENTMLRNQLKAVGVSAVTAVPLATAERLMKDAVQRLVAGDESAERDIERWDMSMRMNPEYVLREERRARAWEQENAAKNKSALRHMRTLIPANINSCTEAELIAKGLPELTTKRIRARKSLWLVRYRPSHIEKLHIAELTSKYSHQGLDILETRAVYAALPTEFENDPDGKKMEWRTMYRQRLQDLCAREKAGKLIPSDTRNRAYKNADSLKLFDPDNGFIHLMSTKSDPFAPVEKPKVTRSRSVYVTKQRDPSAGGGGPAIPGSSPLQSYVSARKSSGSAAEEVRPRPSFLSELRKSKSTGRSKKRDSI